MSRSIVDDIAAMLPAVSCARSFHLCIPIEAMGPHYWRWCWCQLSALHADLARQVGLCWQPQSASPQLTCRACLCLYAWPCHEHYLHVAARALMPECATREKHFLGDSCQELFAFQQVFCRVCLGYWCMPISDHGIVCMFPVLAAQLPCWARINIVTVCNIDRQCCSACIQDESCMEGVCCKWRLHAHKAESNSVIDMLPNSESSIATIGTDGCCELCMLC